MSSDIECLPISHLEARALPPIPSAYSTGYVYRLERSASAGEVQWRLRLIALPAGLRRENDDGDFEDWISNYQPDLPPDSLKFVGAFQDGSCVGLLTWTEVRWNNTIWLIDIRARHPRQGIGSALVDWLRRRTRAQGARGVSVETQTTNFPAIQFYIKQGFSITGFNDHLYHNDDLAAGEVALSLFWECPY